MVETGSAHAIDVADGVSLKAAQSIGDARNLPEPVHRLMEALRQGD